MALTDQPSGEQAHKVKIVLVVEDDADIGAFLAEVIKTEMPYQVHHVTNASAALEAVKTIIPDLIVLDYNLPGINGLELADRFQTSEVLKDIPILFMSANLPMQELKKRHFTAIQKPFEIDEFLGTMARLLTS